MTRRQFCLLLKKADELHFLVICDAGFPIFQDSLNFFVVENKGWRIEGKGLEKKRKKKKTFLFFPSLVSLV